MPSTSKRITIGELARRTGVSVKTLRFYSDEGLLPPSGRSESGYRLYDEDQHVMQRIDLIRTLRDANVGLDAIAKVLSRDMSLQDALQLQLSAIEAHVSSLQRVAAAIRAALATKPAPTPQDLQRISMVTRLSNDERRKVLERFYDRVADGVPIDKNWMKGMIDASTPILADNPTPEQLDAWIELAAILEDPSFIQSMRTNASEFWSKNIDTALFNKAKAESIRAAHAAREKGLPPTSPEAKAIVDALVESFAKASGETDTDKLRERMKANADPRAERYWELVGIMRGNTTKSPEHHDWSWVAAGIRHFITSTTPHAAGDPSADRVPS